jgi:hypothetical protein
MSQAGFRTAQFRLQEAKFDQIGDSHVVRLVLLECGKGPYQLLLNELDKGHPAQSSNLWSFAMRRKWYNLISG